MTKMRPFKLLVSYDEAMRIIRESIKPIERTDWVTLENAFNRVLAQDQVAGMNVPPFDRAAMDGYAVKAEDTFGSSAYNPKILKLTGVIHAGEQADNVVGDGECIQIATGCPIPEGADAVVMVEFTERNDEHVSILKPVYPGANISSRGEDIKKGRTILRRRDILTSAKIGVLAALGKEKVGVYERPRIAIVPTGSEICEVGIPLKEDQIYDVNSYTLASIATENGALVTRFRIVPDTYKELKTAVRSLLDHDMIVISGGSSVGERDILYDVISELGTVLFHGVQVKPGKPTLFGLVSNKPIFGMPGYPTSCLSNAYLFLIPAIRQMARLPPKEKRKVKAKLARRVVSSSGREQFLTVKLEGQEAYPVFKYSGAITSTAEADGYIILPVNVDVIEEGEEVTVVLLD